MSRSPYEAPPHYVTCRFCQREYDDTRSHECESEAKATIRRLLEDGHDVGALLEAVRSEMDEGRRKLEREALERDVAVFEARIAEHRHEADKAERALAAARDRLMVSKRG